MSETVSNRQNMSALVVDDARAIRSILKRLLAEIGFENIYEAEDGQKGLDALNEHGRVDLVLADWNMPEMNGLEMVRSIRAQEDMRDMTIMMVTTESEYEKIVRALAAGANEYVMKPFTKEVIVEKLELLGLLPGGS